MAIYHLSVKTISRSAGRSATGAAAYRAGCEITDDRTGEVHDYTRKGGIESVDIVLPQNPPDWALNRSELWNKAEQAENRKNSTVAREFEIALPSELSADSRRELALEFARELVGKHGFAADVAIHAPSRGGDNRNHHAHILCTTRRLQGDFTEKTRELDDRKSGEIEFWRERFAEITNKHLRAAGITELVDHRTLEAQGIDREADQHLGPSATGYERRTGEKSKKRLNHEERIKPRVEKAIKGALDAVLNQPEIQQGIKAARQAYEQFKQDKETQQRQKEMREAREKELLEQRKAEQAKKLEAMESIKRSKEQDRGMGR